MNENEGLCGHSSSVEMMCIDRPYYSYVCKKMILGITPFVSLDEVLYSNLTILDEFSKDRLEVGYPF